MLNERLLVPLDLSGHYELVLGAVEELGARAPVTLLHVIEPIQGIPDEELEDFYANLDSRALTCLEKAALELRSRGIECEIEILRGHRGRTIVEIAAERGITTILIGSHPLRRDEPHGGLGSTSHEVAIAAPCSVILLRETER